MKTEDLGMLEVTAAEIVIPGEPDPDARFAFTGDMPEDKVYNGSEQKWEPTISDKETGKTLAKGTDYTVSYSEDCTNVGAVIVTIKGVGNYSGEVVRFYHITKAPLIVTTSSASKRYDGTPLTADGTLEGLVNNETATFRTTGTITEEGTAQNTYEIEWSGTAKETNYTIAKEDLGTLTIERPYYTLTINYVFSNGATAAPTFTQQLLRR